MKCGRRAFVDRGMKHDRNTMNNGPFDNDTQQFVVSFQLLQLLRWLFEHEQETLKKVVNRALKNGLDEMLFQPAGRCESEDELQQSIVEFFSLLETLLYESLHEDETKKLKERILIPAVDHIDAAVCDDTLVALSVAKAASAIESNPYEDPKEVLCKELLKRWKPSKKLSMH